MSNPCRKFLGPNVGAMNETLSDKVERSDPRSRVSFQVHERWADVWMWSGRAYDYDTVVLVVMVFLCVTARGCD